MVEQNLHRLSQSGWHYLTCLFCPDKSYQFEVAVTTALMAWVLITACDDVSGPYLLTLTLLFCTIVLIC